VEARKLDNLKTVEGKGKGIGFGREEYKMG
jgi:hypothetical protein